MIKKSFFPLINKKKKQFPSNLIDPLNVCCEKFPLKMLLFHNFNYSNDFVFHSGKK